MFLEVMLFRWNAAGTASAMNFSQEGDGEDVGDVLIARSQFESGLKQDYVSLKEV